MGAKEEIEALFQEYQAAMKAKDCGNIMDQYTDDCVVAYPDVPIMHKKDAKAYFEANLAGVEMCDFKIVDFVEITPDWCVQCGTFKEKELKSGKVADCWYISNFHKVGGKFKIRSDAAGYSKTHC